MEKQQVENKERVSGRVTLMLAVINYALVFSHPPFCSLILTSLLVVLNYQPSMNRGQIILDLTATASHKET